MHSIERERPPVVRLGIQHRTAGASPCDSAVARPLPHDAALQGTREHGHPLSHILRHDARHRRIAGQPRLHRRIEARQLGLQLLQTANRDLDLHDTAFHGSP